MTDPDPGTDRNAGTDRYASADRYAGAVPHRVGRHGGLRVLPVTGIGEVRPGDDLAATIVAAAPWLADGDVVVVTSKIVSKAEGRLADLPIAEPARTAARQAVVAAETVRVVAARGPTRIVQTRHGLVLASAGVDASNVDPSRLVLLPSDPDGSARRLRAELRERYGTDVAVVITDTMGRPWRVGQVDVAIGAAGLQPLLDHRGQRDAYGNELHVTVTAVADQLASAAELVKGKRDGVPVAVVRGWPLVTSADGPGAGALIRDAGQDLFRLGTAEALAIGHAFGATAPADPVDWRLLPPGAVAALPAAVTARLPAFAAVTAAVTVAASTPAAGAPAVGPSAASTPAAGASAAGTSAAGTSAAHTAGPDDPGSAAKIEAALQRLRAALAADGFAASWVPLGVAERDALTPLVPPQSGLPVGLIAVSTAALSP